MDRQEILKRVDHTLLAQTATWQEIKEICDDAVTYQTASVCIPPSLSLIHISWARWWEPWRRARRTRRV